MNVRSGTKTLTLPTLGQLGIERDPFLDGVRAATKGSLEILGELGRTADSTIVYLARRLEGETLVALRLVRLPDSKHEFELDILEELDSSLPAPPAKCPQCQGDLRGWGRFCTKCGADVDTNAGIETPTGRMRAVQQAADGRYEILGQMTHAQGGGFVSLFWQTWSPPSRIDSPKRGWRIRSYEGGKSQANGRCSVEPDRRRVQPHCALCYQ